MRRIPSFMAALALAVVPSLVCAGGFPEPPITIVVAFQPGGTTDLVARQLAQKMSDDFKTAVLIENKPGANSFIGTSFVARAAKDGYTLLLAGPSAFVTGPHLYPNMSVSIKDFDPISMVTKVLFVVQHSGALFGHYKARHVNAVYVTEYAAGFDEQNRLFTPGFAVTNMHAKPRVKDEHASALINVLFHESWPVASTAAG